jgi:hypothetical protein
MSMKSVDSNLQRLGHAYHNIIRSTFSAFRCKLQASNRRDLSNYGQLSDKEAAFFYGTELLAC